MVSSEVSIRIATDSDFAQWQSYAQQNGDCHCYDFRWRNILANCFSHQPYYLVAQAKDSILGLAPLFYIHSFLFGRSLISLPYLNGGGILASDSQTRTQLLQFIEILSTELSVKYTELRFRSIDFPTPDKATVRSHKVAMLLDLFNDPDSLFSSFSAKLRSQIRRPEKSGCNTVVVSGDQFSKKQLDDFYYVFSRNMRDLGTPVYPKTLFSETLKSFGLNSHLAIVYLQNKPTAAGITIDWNRKTEIPWASSLREHNNVSANMALYWSLISSACSRGQSSFDFGRSTPDSGPFRFKKQWGAKPLALNWLYTKDSVVPDVNPNSHKFSLLVDCWRKLPLPMANVIGPILTRNLP